MTVASDELVVRSYLRQVLGISVQRGRDPRQLEADFVRCAARWAKRAKVDRTALEIVGVPARVLKLVELPIETAADRLRRHYSGTPTATSALARRAGVSISVARATLRSDEQSGLVERCERAGRSILWRAKQ